jgi:sulfate/thiosulfate transport system permease protein
MTGLRTQGSGLSGRWARRALIAATLVFLALFLGLPLLVIFVEAFAKGWEVYKRAVTDSDTWAAIRLTMETVAIAVPLNMVFGIAAAYCIAKFDFRGKRVLTTLIDLPIAVSPIVAGLVFVLMFGARGWMGMWLRRHHFPIIFNARGVVLATVFVTFPFVARELIPLMEAQGTDEEEAARAMGARGWQMFFRVTIPNIKWGLLYGVILCAARAVGEFGAVYVVSGSIRGETCTLPLQVEILYNDNLTAAFAVASLLGVVAVGTLILKSIVERVGRE